ncbi:hypothetical protein [Microbacterium sp. MPKO10]|uniref:hypothetical protein n=1 Tax=Microbacterium sp. MPKO10 TaxID=2989818 RepID=UPI002236BAB6|nr:hypothetical protein [Microbacterium sp. MPKO10]MCW4457897.1 hypothetical protein [Microbacterium sp. MPKO10]
MEKAQGRMLRTPGVIIALVAVFALTGCFSFPGGEGLSEEAAKEGAEKLVEEFSGGDSDIEIGEELPDNFPDSVPLIDAPIVSASYLDMDDSDGTAVRGWIVAMTADVNSAAAEEARQLLLDAGFTEEMWNESTGMTTGMFSNDDFGVTLGVISEDGTVSYTVIPKKNDE